jgi:electron transfer flavoprotein beta subunit
VIVVVAQKWVDRRPEVDLLTGAVRTDPRTSGPSAADEAALEWALRATDAWGGEVVAITAGPVAAEDMLRAAIAAGAGRAVRVDLDPAAPSDAVAAGLAPVAAGADLVLCGDWSLDRGSGAVPAYLAGHLGAAQALGCTGLELDPGAPGAVRAERRLDGGRRERLQVRAPCVVSVEGRTARLRRAPLDRVLEARRATIGLVPVAPGQPAVAAAAPTRSPYRPRARHLPPPPADLDARQRILALSGALTARTPPELLVLEPAAAADRILEQLRGWGYLG